MTNYYKVEFRNGDLLVKTAYYETKEDAARAEREWQKHNDKYGPNFYCDINYTKL